jgi:hypothetical protein
MPLVDGLFIQLTVVIAAYYSSALRSRERTRLLVPLLTASAQSRVVNVGSLGQVASDPDDAEFEHWYNGVDVYRRSKLAPGLENSAWPLSSEAARVRW